MCKFLGVDTEKKKIILMMFIFIAHTIPAVKAPELLGRNCLNKFLK